MAEHNIFIFSLQSDRGSGFDTGDQVICRWDDVSEEIVVYLSEGFTSPTETLVTSGPSLGTPFVVDTGYKFCDLTTLVYFQYNAGVFPYAIKREQEDSITCLIGSGSCDIEFADNPIVTAASNINSNDGAFTVSASSTFSEPKYALFDFDYYTQGQSSGTFTGKFAGTYTVYAKDSNLCVATKVITVPLSQSYAIRHVCEWTAIESNGTRNHKIEILQRGYTGGVETLEAADQPMSYKEHSENEDKFYVIRASSLVFRFAASTDFNYTHLYTEDDREFLLKHYIDDGGYVLDWTGYLKTFLYNEQWIAPPFYIEVEATDGLAELKFIDFTDASGNNYQTHLSAMQIVSSMLKKLDLGLNIRSAVNMYEASMDNGDADDPLTQAFYDSTLYYSDDGTPEKSDVVIKNILQEYRAFIAQADGKWFIGRPEEFIAEFDYREFTSDGVYDSNGTIDPAVSIDVETETGCFHWLNKSGVMSFIPSYGTFKVIQRLKKKASLLPSYGFEEKDISPLPDGSQFFKGWNISISLGTFTWGFQRIIDRAPSKGALYVDFGGIPSEYYQEGIISAINIPIQFKTGDKIKISLDYFIQLFQESPWVQFDFKLKIGDFWLFSDSQIGFSQTDTGWIPFYGQTFNEWQNFSLAFDSPNHFLTGNETREGKMEFYLKFNNGGVYRDVDSGYVFNEAELDATTTLESTPGYVRTGTRKLVKCQVNDTSIRGYFILEEGAQEDYEDTYSEELGDGKYILPSVIRPNDFNVIFPKTWVLKGQNNGLINVDYFLFDNFRVEYLHNGVDNPETQTYTLVCNQQNKRTYEIEIFHGDCPPGITNAKNLYQNIIKYDTPAEFLPTEAWTRDGHSEAEKIQTLLLKSSVEQLGKANKRLTGNIFGDVYLKPYSRIIEVSDSARKYIVQGYEQSGRLNEYTIDLTEVKEEQARAFGAAFSPPQFGSSFDVS